MHRPLLLKLAVALSVMISLATGAFAATAVKVNFTLNTTDKNGAPIVQNRYYYRYRPDGFPVATPLPAILVMEEIAGGGANWVFNAKADQVGIVVVTCAIPGNSLGGSWVSRDPRWVGYEDYDYTSEVINQVKASDNCNDFFICGLSKGGVMAYTFACYRPAQIKAASSLEEFFVLVANTPSAPVPVIAFEGTADANPYSMTRDAMDIWRTMDGLLNTPPVTTFESSPLMPGNVTQATWFGGTNETQVAWVTLIGGTHSYPTPATDTGYNVADGIWAFFSQFLTSSGAQVRIVSQPVNNTQYAGQPASFWVTATGDAPITYQWQKNGTNIPGASSRWYTTPPTTLADNGTIYRVRVTNGLGSVISSIATLSVLSPPAGPSVTLQPVSVAVTAGQAFSFSVAASGAGPVSYQWQKDGMDLASATSATYSGHAAVPPDSGSVFHVLVRDSTGTTTSRGATLTVLPAPRAPIILANPRRVSVFLNQTGPFSVRAWSATPMTCQWQMAPAGNANLADIPGATNATYTPPASASAVNQPYRCIVSNPAGSTASACELFISDPTAYRAVFFAGPNVVSAQIGQPFSYQIWVRGATLPVTYLASPLPPGLSVDASTGVISGVPTTLGTNRISISASNSGGILTGTLTLSVTATPPPIPVGDWRSANFGASAIDAAIAGDSSDPDGDGWPNLVEYAVGTDPLAPTQLLFGLPLQDGFLTQTATKNPNATGISWSAESSSDLLNWSGTNITVLQDTPAIFKARDNTPVGASGQEFLRLKVALTPGSF